MPVRTDADDGHTVVQNAHEDGSDDCSSNRTGSTIGGSTTDEAGADGIHLIVGTCGWGGRIEAGHANQGSHSREEAHIGIGEEENLVGVDA
ncbi:hypothetical protein SDC9_93416 [bioreactor metagenome]|uniref:Uncharacterized protein n=1 Tax=bioreactor metagenome TaxID=1076179 RepID=A0A645A0J7_9ZZZZ